MTNEKLSDLLNFKKKLKMRQHLKSLQNPCISSSFEILPVMDHFDVFPISTESSGAVNVSKLNLQATKLDI